MSRITDAKRARNQPPSPVSQPVYSQTRQVQEADRGKFSLLLTYDPSTKWLALSQVDTSITVRIDDVAEAMLIARDRIIAQQVEQFLKQRGENGTPERPRDIAPDEPNPSGAHPKAGLPAGE